jgi:hypothetical protein
MAIQYNPSVQFTPWTDNVDRVSAGGSNGFNVRFSSIEAEFQTLAQVIQQVNTALSALGDQVSAPITIALTPVMLPFGSNSPWSPVAWSRVSAGVALGTFAEKPSGQEQAWGVLPLNLPNGATLINLKVLGEQVGPGDVVTELFQEARTEPYTRTTLLTINGLATAAAAPTPIPNSVVFNGLTNQYYLLTRVTNTTTATTAVRLRGFQVTYQMS